MGRWAPTPCSLGASVALGGAPKQAGLQMRRQGGQGPVVDELGGDRRKRTCKLAVVRVQRAEGRFEGVPVLGLVVVDGSCQAR